VGGETRGLCPGDDADDVSPADIQNHPHTPLHHHMTPQLSAAQMTPQPPTSATTATGTSTNGVELEDMFHTETGLDDEDDDDDGDGE
jgi:hypothetical protein